MKPIDIVILALVALLVVGIIVYVLWKKKKGEKIGCGCGGCNGCGSANACPSMQKAQEETQSEEKANIENKEE